MKARNYFAKTISLAFTLMIVASFNEGCTHKESSDFDNYVHEYLESNVKGFDPVVSGDLYSGIVMSQIFEGLMQYTYLERPIKAEPLLADGMPEISKDGLTYTFKIKKGVLFHDDPSFKDGKGRELTSEDFIYSWKRLADPALHSDMFWIFDGKVKGMTEYRDHASKVGKLDYAAPLEGFTAVDKYTLKISLIKPYPQILYVLTMAGSYPVPREAVEHYGAEFQNHPVGTGPYKFRSWTRNAQIVLDKNPLYHEDYYPKTGEPEDSTNGNLADAGKRLPLNDGVVFTEVVEDQPRWLNFRKGIFDWVKIPKDNFDSVVKNDQLIDSVKSQGVALTKWTEPDLTYESFNLDDPLMKNKYLRQAMSLAVNTPEMITKFYNDHAIAAQGPIPPGVSGYDPTRKDPYKTHDLEKAKALMKKAGYPDGVGLPEIVYETYSGSTVRQLVEYLQQNEALIGVKIKINMNTWPEFRDKIKTRKAQMFGLAWSADYPDGENFLQLFYSPNASPGSNDSNFKNAEFDKLYEEAASLQDSPARNKLYQKMVDIVVEECPLIYQVHRRAYILTNGWLKNYKRNLTILNYIKYYRIDQQQKTELKKKL